MPLVSDTDVVEQSLNLLLFVSLVSTLELVEDIQVLLWGEQVKQNIVLGAHSHGLPGLTHLGEHVEAEQFG